ncbi:MAG: hypothetical protein EPN82_13765 [Bacteroidetes bacterium]|nr:MAG: hypothetical protein EPN82_13765 [Bacteroidota bacterium]
MPDLSNNIKCGNSLIGSDFYDGKETLFDMEEQIKVNAFDWEKEFPEVFRNGGFDAVIGNPPYVLLEGEFRDDDMLGYLKKKYFSPTYKIDLYHIFIEKGINLISKKGIFGFITPSNYLTNNGLENLRKFILKNSTIEKLNIIKGNVFYKVSVNSVISIISKSGIPNSSNFIYSEWSINTLKKYSEIIFDQSVFSQNEFCMFTTTQKVIESKNSFLLGKRFNVKFGMQLRDRKVYKSDVISLNDINLITGFHRKCYTGKDISRYFCGYSDLLAYFNREAKSGGCWDEKYHNANPKILVRQIGDSPLCCLDENGYCCLNTLFMITKKDDSDLSLNFILGILNSNYIRYYWKEKFSDKRQTFPKIKGSFLEQLPIPNSQLPNPQYDRIVSLVEQMLELNKKVRTLQGHEKTVVERQIESTDRQIDKLVYELYGLTEEEIKVVEGV